jgi:hypothetical protein
MKKIYQILTGQNLLETAYVVVVGYLDTNEKKNQTSYQIKAVNVIKKKN